MGKKKGRNKSIRDLCIFIKERLEKNMVEKVKGDS